MIFKLKGHFWKGQLLECVQQMSSLFVSRELTWRWSQGARTEGSYRLHRKYRGSSDNQAPADKRGLTSRGGAHYTLCLTNMLPLSIILSFRSLLIRCFTYCTDWQALTTKCSLAVHSYCKSSFFAGILERGAIEGQRLTFGNSQI